MYHDVLLIPHGRHRGPQYQQVLHVTASVVLVGAEGIMLWAHRYRLVHPCLVLLNDCEVLGLC